jgi:UDP-N-acetylmuramate dehydrogenase
VPNWEDLRRQITEKTGFRGILRLNEPMTDHTTFKTGGPADMYIVPSSEDETVKVLRFLETEELPFFILGGGANILVADRGIRGVVIDMGSLNRVTVSGTEVRAGAGKSISDLALETARKGLSGLHVFYGMPGSVGGAVFMNARCYDGEISSFYTEASVYCNGEISSVPFREKEWDYKHSPFRENGKIILEVLFRLQSGDPDKLTARSGEIHADRNAKGHFRTPCAGSVFKNNRAFGEPSGKIIDRLGLRGYRIGGAAVSDWHANIFINEGGASASDIRDLIFHVRNRVKEETGFSLEPEVLFVGEWE